MPTTASMKMVLAPLALAGLLALAAAPPELAGQHRDDAPVVLITGSTGGLGREVARAFAERGAHVIVHGRSVERGETLVAEIEADGMGSARFYRADLADFDEVRAFAAEVKADYDRIDILINNAGILMDGERRVTDDGSEIHFQVNHLSHFLLTYELMPILRAAPSQIINVASLGQAPIDFDDPHMADGYSVNRAYGQSKLAQISFTFELAERLQGTEIRVNALHPATAMDTDMVLEMGWDPATSVEDGVETVMFVATKAEGSGRFYNRLQPAEAHAQANDEEARARLWALSEELTGVEWDRVDAPD